MKKTDGEACVPDLHGSGGSPRGAAQLGPDVGLSGLPTPVGRRTLGDRVTGRHLVRRLVQLYLGLAAFGVSMALLVRSDLGNTPWDVLHQGLVRQLGGTIGQWSIAVGVVVLLLWIPLRERPGIGTVSNVFVIGIFVDLTLAHLPELDHLAGRVGYVVGGILLNAAATAAYIGARFGPGPRDGLMTGFTRRTRFSLRFVRTTIEVVVVLTGWLLGGRLGIATVVFAVTIGPLVQLMMGPFRVPEGARSRPAPVPPLDPLGPDTLAA
ncbi:MAG TPA: hypothetical protein VFL94_09475 [Actinomycetales bacterium]|nr:hypothetical protein [Actinomycetales bacterium]